ncbi:sulfotransferase family protein [Marinoscillum furvescens]|uniref:Sulfotransferase family protein n=1 Tax=Marinoscillum furvescens DSM 4134 TaxID=1122208 RepID=A0A3D9KZS5_MARFU|nr:sulfotransferase [Marinoscillum furvescens]RED96150.1 sulfotransferase family protein [Marinoscillum furvescens DSM 4134]
MTDQQIDNALKNSIIVIGAPRSGTSVLARILEAHPASVHIKEPRTLWKFGNDRKSDCLSPSDITPQIKKHIRKKLASWVLAEQGSILVEKTPSNALRLEFCKEIIPEAKFIHIIRNGYDSSLSIRDYWNNFRSGIIYNRTGSKTTVLQQRLKELSYNQVPFYVSEFLKRALPLPARLKEVPWGPRFPGLMATKKAIGTLGVASLQWRYCVECACHAGDQLPDDKYLEVRLEDLDEDMLDQILKFAGISKTNEIKTYFHENYRSVREGQRYQSATQEELKEMNKWIAPTIDWLNKRRTK